MVAEVQRRARARKRVAKTLLPIPKRQRVDGFAIKVEQIEQEKRLLRGEQDEKSTSIRVRKYRRMRDEGRA